MTKHDDFITETNWLINSIFRRKKEFYKTHRMKYNLSFTNLNKMYNDLHIIRRTVHTDLNYILRKNFNFNYDEAHTITTWFLVEKRIYVEKKLFFSLSKPNSSMSTLIVPASPLYCAFQIPAPATQH